MDDETGWNEILVDGWGPLVRAAVCDRVEEAFEASRGVLAETVTDPDAAPVEATERVHDAIVAAIARETGADLDLLGSQAAWATYDDTWAELGRRAEDLDRFEPVGSSSAAAIGVLLAGAPTPLVEAAGALREDDGTVRLAARGGRVLLDVEGIHRWLALDEEADDASRRVARDVVALARSR